MVLQHRERWGWRELMCELFQECLRGNVLIGTLRLDKDVRFKRSKVIIKYTTGRCCSKNIFAASSPWSPFLFFLFPLYLSLSCQRWKENLISIRLNCGGQHYQFKRPGDLTAPTPWWLITSQQWWALLSPFFACMLLYYWWWWLEATHDKCCPYYWSLWEKAQTALG